LHACGNTTLSCISEMSNSDKNAKLLSDVRYKEKSFIEETACFLLAVTLSGSLKHESDKLGFFKIF
jgi:hypothetical protein